MTYRSHLIIGGIFGLLFNVPVVASMIGAVLPDIDLKWSKMYSGSGLFTSHRGITHHVIVGFIGFLSMFLIPAMFRMPVLYSDMFKGLVVGYISHLFADTMTKSGIPYWGHKDRISVGLFRTRSLGEYIFVYALLLLTILYVVIENQLPYEFKFISNMVKEILSVI